MIQLFSKTVRPFIIYALLVIIFSVFICILTINYSAHFILDQQHSQARKRIETNINQLSLNNQQLPQFINSFNNLSTTYRLERISKADMAADSFFTSSHYSVLSNEKEEFRCLSTYILINRQPYRLLVESNLEPIQATGIIIILFALVCIVSMLAGLEILLKRLTGKINRPFQHIVEQIKSFNLATSPHMHFFRTPIREFATLQDSLNDLARNNSKEYIRQKEFVENALAELQTPLNTLQSQLVIAQENKIISESQTGVLDSLSNSLSHIARLNSNLLLLTKIENCQFHIEEKVEVSTLVNRCIATLQKNIDEKQQAIETFIEKNVYITANKCLMEILVNNLLLNAIQHSREQSHIYMILTGYELKISNQGTHSLSRDKLFPYNNHNSISSQAVTGNQLGLTIIQQICLYKKWRLEYDFQAGLHTFSVFF